MRSAFSLVESLAQRESVGETCDCKELDEKGQNLKQIVNSTIDSHDRDGCGCEQSAHAPLRPYADRGGKITDCVSFAKGEAGTRVDGSVEAGNKTNQSLD